MATTWNITVGNSAFTVTVVNNDDGTWSYQLNPPNGSTGNLPSGFAFTSAFDMGTNDEYAFAAGTEVTPDEYTGSVSYSSQVTGTTTTWTAQKKSSVARKHQAA